MTDAPRVDVDPFAHTRSTIAEPDPVRPALRAAGPLVVAEAPAGGPVWIVTEGRLARTVLAHPDIAKDPAYAPASWDRRTAGLEPTAAEHRSLTTLDGAEHQRVRRPHVPLLTARRVRDRADRIAATARTLLTDLAAGGTADLVDDFTTRFPLTVICEVVGVAPEYVDTVATACTRLFGGDPDDFATAMAAFDEVAGAALQTPEGLAAELRARLAGEVTEPELRYLLFGMIFAGQLTTEAALGFLLARVLCGALHDAAGADAAAVEQLVHDALRHHPPAPFTLWRFTTTEVELAGVRLPARAPVLVDIQGINTAPGAANVELTFGAGPHYCIGAQLARLELETVVHVLRTEFPRARLTTSYERLECAGSGLTGRRVAVLPAELRG